MSEIGWYFYHLGVHTGVTMEVVKGIFLFYAKFWTELKDGFVFTYVSYTGVAKTWMDNVCFI